MVLSERGDIPGIKMHDGTTHGILHVSFRGFRAFVTRKNSLCKLIGNHLVIPHDTIP